MFCWKANWNLLKESAAWLWNFPKIGRNRKRKWNIFKTDRIDRILPHFYILLSPVKSRTRRNDLRFSIRSGGGLRHGHEYLCGEQWFHRKNNDSGQERVKRMFRNGWMDWDCKYWEQNSQKCGRGVCASCLFMCHLKCQKVFLNGILNF